MDSRRADSQSLSMARARNYPMCKNALREGRFSDLGEVHRYFRFDYALIAAMSGWIPIMLITRVIL